jgi:hypothetical protein
MNAPHKYPMRTPSPVSIQHPAPRIILPAPNAENPPKSPKYHFLRCQTTTLRRYWHPGKQAFLGPLFPNAFS